MSYDSTEDTVAHRDRVGKFLYGAAGTLTVRAMTHDWTKLREPEKSVFDKMTPKLKGSTFGSDEYKGFLKEMKVALDHHYENNSHHPEHYKLWKCPVCLNVFRDEETKPSACYEGNPRFCPECCPIGTIMECILEPHVGLEGMTMIDLIEMLADWKAASERHANGDIENSFKINEKRYNIPPVLMRILRNTMKEMLRIDKKMEYDLLTCDNCERVFTRDEIVKAKKEQNFPDEVFFECECGHKFKLKKQLKGKENG